MALVAHVVEERLFIIPIIATRKKKVTAVLTATFCGFNGIILTHYLHLSSLQFFDIIFFEFWVLCGFAFDGCERFDVCTHNNFIISDNRQQWQRSSEHCS